MEINDLEPKTMRRILTEILETMKKTVSEEDLPFSDAGEEIFALLESEGLMSPPGTEDDEE